ncbi:WXG100 family type VII secretion target [Streptomyces sp. NPDC053427]|uniref:WXG100 family type VII secretion target n=1 Tax=Streptomyces sp. NPDC053427 TaxID=3365701 RepID=UPI0037D2919D
MASKETDFKPGQVHVPKTSTTPAKGSGEAQEQGPAILQSRPQFTEKELGDLKAMVAGSNPGEVGNVAEGWKKVRVSLVGEDWHTGIKKQFDDAVTKVLKTWHGPSADQFAKTAQGISDDFGNLASYPHVTGHVLHQISENLGAAKTAVEAIEEPDWLDDLGDKIGDSAKSVVKGSAVGTLAGGPGAGTVVGGVVGFFTGGRDDSGLKADLKNPNMTIGEAAQRNAGNIDPDKQASLLAGHYMEQLATTYRAGSKALRGVGGIDDDGRIRRPDNTDGGGDIGGITPFVPPGSGPKGGATVPKIPGMKGGGYTTPQPMEPPRPGGIDGGIGSIPKSPVPHVGTGLDGFSGGLGTGGGGIGGGIGGGAGGGVGTGGLSGSGVGGGSTSGIGGGGMPGMPGMVGGGAAGRGGGGAGAGARGGVGAGARGGGRAGMPGMAGGAGAGAGKGAGAKGAGGGGALARQKGGVVGGKGGKSGVGGQGGSGLHRSRGGTQKGVTGGRRPAGMAGAPGAHGGKGKDNKGENGQRPDYLVEDEETWTKERNVAPKVIE